ncbi:MAG: hypothetical protein IT285_02695 [Bdellovibrionales bacterium]|nr:hypothetical protein [Bdellovibrionales bacterium]
MKRSSLQRVVALSNLDSLKMAALGAILGLILSAFVPDVEAGITPDYWLQLPDAAKEYVRGVRTRCGTGRDCYVREMLLLAEDMKSSHTSAVASMPQNVRGVVGNHCNAQLGTTDDFIPWLLCYRDGLDITGGDIERFDALRGEGKTAREVLATMTSEDSFLKYIMARECRPLTDHCMDAVLLGLWQQGNTAYNHMARAAGNAILFSAISFECGNALNNAEACRGARRWGRMVAVRWARIPAPAVAHATPAPQPDPTDVVTFDDEPVTVTVPRPTPTPSVPSTPSTPSTPPTDPATPTDPVTPPTDPATPDEPEGDGGTGDTPAADGTPGDPNGSDTPEGGNGGTGNPEGNGTGNGTGTGETENPNPNPNPNPDVPNGGSPEGGSPNGTPDGVPGGTGDVNQAGSPGGTGSEGLNGGEPLNCSTEARMEMQRLMTSGNMGLRMTGRSQYFACRVQENHATNASAVFMANAAMMLSHAATSMSLQELRAWFPWAIERVDALLARDDTPGKEELRDLRTFLVEMQRASDSELIQLSLNPAQFRSRLEPRFCPWKNRVEAADPQSTLLFPRDIARCPAAGF